jgi:hypothetical protein
MFNFDVVCSRSARVLEKPGFEIYSGSLERCYQSSNVLFEDTYRIVTLCIAVLLRATLEVALSRFFRELTVLSILSSIFRMGVGMLILLPENEER